MMRHPPAAMSVWSGRVVCLQPIGGGPEAVPLEAFLQVASTACTNADIGDVPRIVVAVMSAAYWAAASRAASTGVVGVAVSATTAWSFGGGGGSFQCSLKANGTWNIGLPSERK